MSRSLSPEQKGRSALAFTSLHAVNKLQQLREASNIMCKRVISDGIYLEQLLHGDKSNCHISIVFHFK